MKQIEAKLKTDAFASNGLDWLNIEFSIFCADRFL